MGKQVVTARLRIGYVFKYVGEETLEALNALLAALQLAACPGFYPTASTRYYWTACYLFLATSLVGGIIQVHALLESAQFLTHHARGAAQPSEAEIGRSEREVCESVCYLASSLLFAAGSVLFLPDVYEHNERNDLTAGTALFLAGSLLLQLAAFVNLLSVSVTGRMHKFGSEELGVLSLLCSQAGSAAYSMGSLGYFPQLEGDGSKWNPLTVGTNLYVIGAALYLVGGMLNCALVVIKRRHHRKIKEPRGRLRQEV